MKTTSFFQQTWGLIGKDLKQWIRDPQAIVGPMILPIILMIFCAIMFGYGGDEWNIGLVVEANGPEAQRFAQTIEDLDGNISPYFRVITRDAAEANALADAGRLHMVITIPADFDAAVAAGETPTIETRVFNLNTDITKNVRLRLERAVQDYLEAKGEANLKVMQFTTRPDDVWRRTFIAGGGVVLALLIGATMNSAIIIAREWERSTVKEIRLAPATLLPVVTGKLVAGLIATLANIGIAMAVAMGFFGLRFPADRWGPLLLIGFGVAVAAAGFGLGVGAAVHDYRILQPLMGILLAGSFFASGGYASIATLPPFVRAFNVFWPPSYIFETMHAWMHLAEPPAVTGVVWWLPLGVVVCVVFGAGMVRRAMK